MMLEYSAFYRETGALIKLARERDVGVVVMRPLGGSGRMSGVRAHMRTAGREATLYVGAAAEVRAVQRRRLGSRTGGALPVQGQRQRLGRPGLRASRRGGEEGVRGGDRPALIACRRTPRRASRWPGRRRPRAGPARGCASPTARRLRSAPTGGPPPCA